MPKKNLKIGLIDADLLCNGTRHPNLALLKIAGFFRDNGFVRGITDDANSYELITNENNFDDLQKYDYFYVSCVFTFTIDDPPLVLTTLLNDKKLSLSVCEWEVLALMQIFLWKKALQRNVRKICTNWRRMLF